MKTTIPQFTLISLGLAGSLFAEEAASATAASEPVARAISPAVQIQAVPADPVKPEKEKAADSAEPADSKEAKKPQSKEAKRQEKMKEEQERLALENALADERVKKETAKLRAEISRLKVEKELISERLAHAAALRREAQEDELAKLEEEKSRLSREASLAKVEAEAMGYRLKVAQAEAGLEVTRLQGQISGFEMEVKRKHYADAKPVYLKNPLKKGGTLVISDRRIALNGAISGDTADYITDRIHYFNNQDKEMPIFLVIDESPGGSVMAGYRILKAMEASEAPVHVVVKSFAASMAAAITTLAEESYAYPNAVILHHQVSATLFGRMNLTQQAEFYKESKRWWTRLATPISDKMGISTEEMIKQMYEHSSSGDWSEFGVEAQKLKWVNHIVTGIDETAILRSPDAKKETPKTVQKSAQVEEVDEDGRPVMYLPRINPKDVYFIYNPDGYYRMR